MVQEDNTIQSQKGRISFGVRGGNQLFSDLARRVHVPIDWRLWQAKYQRFLVTSNVAVVTDGAVEIKA